MSTRPPHRAASRRRGYALPMVVLMAVVGSIAVVSLMQRQTAARLAVRRQVTAYESHHLQQGLKDIIQFWLTVCKRADASTFADGTLGFDLRLEDGYTVEVRLYDAQGALLRALDLVGRLAPTAMDFAADALARSRQVNPYNVRFRGPGRLSLNGAPREALVALVEAISANSTPAGFADAVLSARRRADITDKDLDDLLPRSGLSDDDQEELRSLVVTESSFWKIEATLRSRSGEALTRQGGLANGQLKAGVLATNSAWSILTWAELPSEELPGWAR